MRDMFKNDAAFWPMFDEIVKVTAKRPGAGNQLRVLSGGYRACVMPVSNDDPFDEADAQTTRMRFSVLIAKTGPNAWNDRSPPTIGDEVELPGGMKASIKKVNQFVDDYFEMEVRQC